MESPDDLRVQRAMPAETLWVLFWELVAHSRQNPMQLRQEWAQRRN
jgi:hypothetical protein